MIAGARVLIVNADDLGFVPSVTRGIVEAMNAGVVRSASLMANMPGAEDAVEQVGRLMARGTPIGVGLHFNIVAGRPLSVRTTLADASGAFHPLTVHAWRAWRRQLVLADVERELRAQIALATALLAPMGARLTHIDSHRHSHCLPGVQALVHRVARELGIPHVRQPVEQGPTLLRRPYALLACAALGALAGSHAPYDDVRFAGVALMRSPRFGLDLEQLFDALPEGRTELMVHPGYDSPELAAMDGYRAARERELRALTEPAVMPMLEARGIRLAHFGATAPPG